MRTEQEAFDEMDHHLKMDETPSTYFNRMIESSEFNTFPLSMLSRLRHTEQSPVYHPEGNVWNHTMLVVDRAAHVRGRSRDSNAFMWAAILHDIGKFETTRKRNGKITSYDHDKAGAARAEQFLEFYSEDPVFIKKVVNLVRWHMQILFAVKDTRFSKIAQMDEETDLHEVALLGLCDRLGRVGADEEGEKAAVRQFLQKCSTELNREIVIEI